MAMSFKNFIEFYNAFFEKVYKYVFFRIGRDKDLAEDMTSEIFLKALENFDSYDHTRPFAVWIYRIAHNHLVDYYKKFKTEVVPIDEKENQLGYDDNFEKELENAINFEQVKKGLKDLTPMQKEVILMKYTNDLSNKEIAEILKTNEVHIRVLHHRALSLLKSNYSHLNNGQ